MTSSDRVRDYKSLYSMRPDCKSARTGMYWKIYLSFIFTIMIGMTTTAQVSPSLSLFRSCWNQHGGTSTELLHVLKRADTEKQYIDYSQNIGMLESIMSLSKTNKHLPQKLGGVVMSCIYVDSDGKHHYLIFVSQPKRKGIVDLSEKLEYWPKSKDVKQLLDSLILRCPLTKVVPVQTDLQSDCFE